MFAELESAPTGATRTLADVLDHVRFNEAGLVPAVAQDATSREVLMLAWMNRRALERTLSEGFACYWSRSRQAFWRKGESSVTCSACASCGSTAMAMRCCCW